MFWQGRAGRIFWKTGSGVLESKEAGSQGEGQVMFCLACGVGCCPVEGDF
jgi:hypothetical protein